MMGRIRFVYHSSVDVCTPTLLHAKISLRTAQSYQHLCYYQNKTLNILSGQVWAQLSVKLVCHSLFGGGGGGGGLGPVLLIVSAADKGTGFTDMV